MTDGKTRFAGATFAPLGFGALLLSACRSPPPEPPASRTVAPSAPVPTERALAPRPVASARAETDTSYRFPNAARIVAIGDIHGDLAAAEGVLRLAGAIDREDRWVGGALVVVQTGDEIDRGNDDRKVLDLFARLGDVASAAGGAVHALNGNHETMNVAGDFRYVTAAGFAAFSDVDSSRLSPGILAALPRDERGRAAAFSPGGPYARHLAERDTAIVVGDTAFVHGGLAVAHTDYGVGRLNREIKRWMAGGGDPPALATDPDGPLWTRRYSDDASPIDCDGLAAALERLHVRRMVVGHTPHQHGIDSACEGRVFRIDTGLSRYYGGPVEALEIRGDTVTILGPPAKPAAP